MTIDVTGPGSTLEVQSLAGDTVVLSTGDPTVVVVREPVAAQIIEVVAAGPQGQAGSINTSPLTGLSLAVATVISAADTALSAFGKLQAQLTQFIADTATALGLKADAAAVTTALAAKADTTTVATALAGKEPSIAAGTAAQYWRGDKTFQTLNKAAVGLGSVDNTADAAKSVASAAALTTARAIDGQAFDGSAAITVIAPGTHAAASKATPVDADELPLVDSAAANVLKKLTWANLKATLKTYLDTLYATTTYADAAVAAAVPPGKIEWFAMNTLPTGFLKANGATPSRTTFAALFAALVKSGTVTITNATPAVVTWTAHGRSANDPVKFKTTGGLPTGLTAGTTYFVRATGLAANTFQVSATAGGVAINTSSAGTGVHTAIHAPFGDGDGSTTFTLPDLRGEFPRGWDDSRGADGDTNRAFGSLQGHAFQSHTHTNGFDLSAGVAAAGGAIGQPANTGVNATGTSATETRGRNVALMACIKF